MIAAFSFLTCFGTGAAPTAKTARFFGVVGVALGLVLGGSWVLLDRWQPPLVAAVLVVVIDAALTGMLHFDGLADSGDGLCAPMPRNQRLAVMRTPDVGAFGVVVVVLVLFLRVATLAAIEPNVWLLASVWAASRALAALVIATVPYARTEGLASAFAGDKTLTAFAAGSIVVAALIGLAWQAPEGLVPVAGVVVAAMAVLVFARERLGGYTGDVLGALIVIGETVGLLVASGLVQ